MTGLEQALEEAKRQGPEAVALLLGLQPALDTLAEQAKIRSLLSHDAIKRHMEQGTIVIEPFNPANLKTVSYDCTLGEYYFEEQESMGHGVLNPYDPEQVARVWGKAQHAVPRKQLEKKLGIDISKGIGENDLVILVRPGETILCHTKEFVGGTRSATTMMKGRSSYGRLFIDPCKAAGWGDIGYINRWTLEVTNFSKHYHIPLVVGRRCAQMAFFEVEPIMGEGYEASGKYQTEKDLKTLMENWKPEMMLPQLYKDPEAKPFL